MSQKRPVILLINNVPDYAALILKAFGDLPLNCLLYHVDEYNHAISFLRKEGNYSEVPRPDLILLDLNISGEKGYDLLNEIKTDENLKAIPVIGFSESAAKDDILRAYDLYVNSYILKAKDFQELKEIAATIERFWFTIVRLPGNEAF